MFSEKTTEWAVKRVKKRKIVSSDYIYNERLTYRFITSETWMDMADEEKLIGSLKARFLLILAIKILKRNNSHKFLQNYWFVIFLA